MFPDLSALGKVITTVLTIVVMIGVVWVVRFGFDSLPLKAVYGVTGLLVGCALGWLLCERFGSPRLKYLGPVRRPGDVDL